LFSHATVWAFRLWAMMAVSTLPLLMCRQAVSVGPQLSAD
jgi:hypothetical protein